jgi:hypothetical protein
MTAYCRANECSLLLIAVKGRSTMGFERAWKNTKAVLVAAAMSLREFKLKLPRAARVVASGHDCVRAEIRQSATKPFNSAVPRRRYCHARSDLETCSQVLERSDGWPSRSR